MKGQTRESSLLQKNMIIKIIKDIICHIIFYIINRHNNRCKEVEHIEKNFVDK